MLLLLFLYIFQLLLINIFGINNENNNKLVSIDINENNNNNNIIINNNWFDYYIDITIEEYSKDPFRLHYGYTGTIDLSNSVNTYCINLELTSIEHIEYCNTYLKSYSDIVSYEYYEKWIIKEDLLTTSKFSTKYLSKTPVGLFQYDVGIGTYNHNIIKFICHVLKNCQLKIGKFCSFSNNVKIMLDGNHYYKRITTYPFKNIPDLDLIYSNGPIVIGNDVWICDDVTILSNVTIGDGSILGAGSYIRKNVPPYAIVIGNPAVIVGYRFNEIQIEKLLQIKWWDKINTYNYDKDINIIRDLMLENIDDFILKYSS
jgi:acetyltransferase-like isoleucine patch superfamily enzyme